MANDKEESVDRHPSYVTASFSRVTGGGIKGRKFFGSSVYSNSWIMLRIKPSELHHENGYDRTYSGQLPLIEVAFSPAQFAELLTTMNVGDGVPGTLQYFNGKSVKEPDQKVKGEAERSHDHFKKRILDQTVEFDKLKDQIIQILQEKPTIGKNDRKDIAALLEGVSMHLKQNIPYFYTLIEEGIVKMMTQAKAEVDSLITTAVQNTGLEVLRKQGPSLEFKTDREKDVP